MHSGATGHTTRHLRDDAYTSVRHDVIGLIPESARVILDLGCSNGALGGFLKAHSSHRRVFGIEYDARFVEAAGAVLDGVVQADLNRLDWGSILPGVSFDCVIMADVLEHLVDPEKCLAGVLSRCSPGGCVIVSLPNIRHISALWSIFVEGTFPRRERGIFDATHLRWFTRDDAIGMFQRVGLQICDEVVVLRWRDRGGGLLNRRLNRLPRAIKHWLPVRALLTYQFTLCARTRPARSS